MATTPTQIRIDADLKKEASELFSYLGLDMSSAVNLFLRQCVLHEGLPFNVGAPRYSTRTLEAIAEAEKISKDPSAATYKSIEALKAALEA